MLIGDGFFFIVGKDDPTAARQTVRGFLKSFCFTFFGCLLREGSNLPGWQVLRQGYKSRLQNYHDKRKRVRFRGHDHKCLIRLINLVARIRIV
jgi:hypothetical protein